ncbi:OsmC family protein [Herbiconiux sp. CPCC 203407]|uniref:OsmC family protein n=1 Tax=Herbiconiux oxytropis TaxID=2970915 RepID=A0AA41XH67_9MICO|nr:OsmC family protein [Herbiconiux oxytropis]MCS5722598.1 OsmC family protein [Herbiconiux oxytropis]MCS5726388.1 OsmC family protein [Herbiconiux oxytropis]
MTPEHHYSVDVEWLGNRGTGTSHYRDYGRQGLLTAAGKHDIEVSADKTFHGDRDRWNPEELLLAALAECHMLSFLHVAVLHGLVVTAYTDAATGTLVQQGDGGRFTSAELHPVVTLAVAEGAASPSEEEFAALHREAAEKCFIANSVNFPVGHSPRLVVA